MSTRDHRPPRLGAIEDEPAAGVRMRQASDNNSRGCSQLLPAHERPAPGRCGIGRGSIVVSTRAEAETPLEGQFTTPARPA